MNMQKYEISSDFSDEILIDWYPSLLCNFKCSYCFVHKYNDKKFKDKEFYLFKHFLNKNSEHNKIKLRILGGEPSLIPNLNDYLEMLNDNITIELVTNGTGTINELTRVDSIEYSIHLEYYDKYRDKFLNNINNYKKKTIVINVHNTYKNDHKKLNKYKRIINEIKLYVKNNDIKLKFSINPLIFESPIINTTIDTEYFVKYFDLHDFLEDEHYNKYYIKTPVDEIIKISYNDYLEIYRSHNNNFKNNVCYNNYFIVDYDYNLRYNCNGDTLCNILKTPSYNLMIKPIKCKNNYCDEGCFLDCKKIIRIKD